VKEIKLSACPFCGGTEFIETYQNGYASLTSAESGWLGATMNHTVCRDCGSIVRSYVKDPEKLVKKKNRRREL